MFTHLHFHTSYSFLDGFNSIQKAVARVKELGMTACAITDHNILCGCPEFQEECEANGIKPILGYEGYFTPSIAEASKPVEERNQDAINRAIEAGVIEDPAHPENIRVDVAQKYIEDHHLDSQACHDFAKEDPFYDYVPSSKKTLQKIHKLFGYDMRQYHILFLAKNQKGWENLVKLQSESARLCTYNGRFLCDMELIDKYHEGIICTNACIGSYSAKCIERGDEKGAEDYILAMQEIFGDDFYLEIQPLNIKKQHKVNLFYMEMAKKHGIKTVATNDVHYTRKEDYDDHDTLLCIGTGKKKSDVDRMRYSHDFWIKSEEEMYESFAHQQISMEEKSKIDLKEYQLFYTEALKNTSLIADKVETGIRLGSEKPLFSNVRVPHGLTPEKWLTILAYKGMYKYLAKHPEYDVHEYENRMVEELAIINGKGFAPYMLAVKEYVTWANENNCPTGPGRGSAAGSLALFSIGVTKNIDPIQNQLLFSRFLTADRKDPPDVDIDFEYTHRDDVIEHLKDYYGEPNVAHIGTYTLMGVKSGIKDVGRVLEVDYKIVDSITKKIDEINDAPGAKFKDFDAMKEGDENERKAWETFHELEENHQELFRLARTFEGTPRGMGVHASGILVTPMPVSDIFPIRYKDGVAVTLYTGPQLEHYNAIKYFGRG